MSQELSTQSVRLTQYKKLFTSAIRVIERSVDTVHFQLPHCNEVKIERHLSGFGCRIELTIKVCDAGWQLWESDTVSHNEALKMAFENAVSTALKLNDIVRDRQTVRIKTARKGI